MIANLAACNEWHLRVEQAGQHARETRFGLAAQPEQDEVVARKNGVDDLRNDRVLVTHNAREKVFRPRSSLQIRLDLNSSFKFRSG